MMYEIRYAVAPVTTDTPAEQHKEKFNFATMQGTTDVNAINFSK